ncbi:restriction endonuclease subunit S [Flavobacterium sp.]|uniref:restriction endonuclease subunit S n=1 Tax=Flavobacterium sp. TaxID=239 RepID=UPI0032668DDD
MTAKQTLQPKLRFPEFEGDWKKNVFENLVKINQGLQIPISERFLEEVEDSHFYITNEFLKESSQKKYFIKNPTQSVLCTEDDILMTRTGNTGMVVTNVKGAFHNNFFKIRFPESINKGFLYFFLILDKTQNLIKSLAGTSTIPDLNHSDFYKIEFGHPSQQEQTKIANFLSSIDEKINLLKEKKALLEEYKKGMMQKIFNQEIRFKDDNGNDFEDWEEKIFKEIFSFRSTNSLSRDKLNYSEGTVKNIHYGDIHTKFKTLFYLEKENVPFINNDVLIEKIPLDNYLKIADASEDYDDIGKSIEIINLNNAKVLAGLHTFVARPSNNFLSTGFLAYLMKSDNIKLQIKIMAQGTKVLSLSPTRFAEIKFALPCLEEQTKIANFLSAIDEKIALVTTQIKDTQEYKKGLLQQMFV